MATKAQLAAFAAFAEALGFGDAIKATGKAGATVAAAPAKQEMVGSPEGANGYFTEAQLAEGQGYKCRASKPCKRLLMGPNRTATHRGPKSHKPTE